MSSHLVLRPPGEVGGELVVEEHLEVEGLSLVAGHQLHQLGLVGGEGGRVRHLDEVRW